MVDRMVELPSRGIVVEQLIRACLDPPPDRRRRDLPVILLLGIHGSGKTVLLREIERRGAGGVHPPDRLGHEALGAAGVVGHAFARLVAATWS
ncbi:MAG: hypothetical protein ACRDZ4_03560 [Egibacteraceae bacterium]